MIFRKSDAGRVKRATAMAFIAMASIHCSSPVPDSAAAASTGEAQTSSTGAGGGNPVCSSAALCDPVSLLHDVQTAAGGPGTIEGFGDNPANVAAARCVLQKLRDHEVGSEVVNTDNGVGLPCGEVTELVSFGDGSVSVSHRSYCDLGAQGATPSIRRELKPQSYFDDCLAGDDAGLFACVNSVTTDTAVDGDTCPCRGFKGSPGGSCVPITGL